MRRKSLLFLCLLTLSIIFILGSCAHQQRSSVFEKSIWMMHVYNSQYMDYKSMTQMPNLTEAQKEILRKKKEILMKLWPLINTYNQIVDKGGVPSATQEQMITNLLNQLSTLVTKGGN